MGGHTLASGDAFVVKQEAGNGNTWSYTATTDLVITCFGTNSAGSIRISPYTASTSGVLDFLPQGSSTPVAYTHWNKTILKSGTTIEMDNVDVNTYGVWIGGFEL